MPANEETGGRIRVFGRYVMFGRIGSGGMAHVHLGQHVGPMGFCRTVALKRLLPQFVHDPDFVAMFLDEARLAARIQHPNVVSTLDVAMAPDELILVMDYVHGETVAELVRRAGDEPLAPELVTALMTDALYGLHAAHEATDASGAPLFVVHRDVSPQNILVGTDGVARVLDFGIAKANQRSRVTQDGRIKGKLKYMAPEQIRANDVDRRADVFAAAVVTWELLTGERLFDFDDAAAVLHHILNAPRVAPSEVAGLESSVLDEVVLRGLSPDPAHRFESALDMANALEKACTPASHAEVGAWVTRAAGPLLKRRAALVEAARAYEVTELQTEITKADALGSEFRSALRVMVERDERAEALTEPGHLEPVEGEALGHPALETRTDAALDAERPRSELPRWAIAAAAVVFGAGTAVVAMNALSPDERQPTSIASGAVSTGSSPATPSGAVASPEGDAMSAKVATSAADASSAVPVASPTTTVSATAATGSSTASSTKRTQPLTQPPKATPPPRNDCARPYVIGPDGIKRYKRHCLKR